MARFLVLFAAVAAVGASHIPGHFAGAPQPAAHAAPVANVRSFAEASAFENTHNGDGSYRYSYESPEASVHESGSPKAAGAEGAAVTAEGAFSYRAPDGQQVSLSYTADEHGFHPVGSHIPTPPPTPEAILKSLQLIAQNPPSSHNEGAYHPDSDSEVVYSADARSSGYKY